MLPLPPFIRLERLHGVRDTELRLPEVHQRLIVIGHLASDHPASDSARSALLFFASYRARTQAHAALVVSSWNENRRTRGEEPVREQVVGAPENGSRHAIPEGERRDGVAGWV